MNETLIQSSYWYVWPAANLSTQIILQADVAVDETLLKKARLFRMISKYVAILGVIFLIVYFAPSALSALRLGGDEWVINTKNIASNESASSAYPEGASSAYEPALDSSLPLGNYMNIPALGVKTSIFEDSYDNHEEALKKGVWRVNDFGSPSNRELPTIVAAHRFGYLAWSNQYRRENSFYNLPKLEKGDTVEIIWRQRKYVYEVYAASEGADIADYAADLILYTCRDLNSDIRIFRYARLLEI